MPIRSFGLTDVGRKRDHNEDSLFYNDELGLFVVADGMGGHAAGEVASAKAVEVIRDFVKRCREDDEFTWPYGLNPSLDDLQNTLVTAIKLANREVWRLAQDRPEHHGMGTTIASVHVLDNHCAVAHVGDSRVYLVRDRKMQQLTSDHSWVNEQLKRGIISPEEARNHRWKNVITRALGNKEQIEVDVTSIELRTDDVLLICSDGLCAGDDVKEEVILEQILEHVDDLPTASRILIGLANEAGGRDNITVVLLRAFATEADAKAAFRDRSAEDTNPMLLRSQISQSAVGKTETPNKLAEPIEFGEVTKPVAKATSRDDIELDDIFEQDQRS